MVLKYVKGTRWTRLPNCVKPLLQQQNDVSLKRIADCERCLLMLTPNRLKDLKAAEAKEAPVWNASAHERGRDRFLEAAAASAALKGGKAEKDMAPSLHRPFRSRPRSANAPTDTGRGWAVWSP